MDSKQERTKQDILIMNFFLLHIFPLISLFPLKKFNKKNHKPDLFFLYPFARGKLRPLSIDVSPLEVHTIRLR